MSHTQSFNLFATTPKGLELLLVDELRSLGATHAAEKLAGVVFTGDLQFAYKACLWSRLANRILLQLANVPAATPEALYAGVRSINWSEHMSLDATFAVHFVTTQSAITHTLFGAQKVKDAIVDQFREKFGDRPNVERTQPDVSVYVYLHRDQAMISLDLSGDSLHKRGYRLAGGAAPLKENLAAALLLRAGWPAIAKNQGTLLDPMCGSGTLLIEAAMMAANIAPGLARSYFGFMGWKKHNPAVWQALLTDAKAQQADVDTLPTIIGYDANPDAITIAFENIERAGFHGKIHVEKRELRDFAPRKNLTPGLIITNPPYGERLGEMEELKSLYTTLGEQLKAHFIDWKAAVFTGNPDLGKEMGIRAARYYALFNGGLPCKLLLFDVNPTYFIDRSPKAINERRIRAAERATSHLSSEQIQMFVNRVQKNLRQYKRHLAQHPEQISYRLYNADIPEYAFVIDINPNGVQVYEYTPPRSVDPKKALLRQQQVLAHLPSLLEVEPGAISFSMLAGKN